MRRLVDPKAKNLNTVGGMVDEVKFLAARGILSGTASVIDGVYATNLLRNTNYDISSKGFWILVGISVFTGICALDDFKDLRRHLNAIKAEFGSQKRK
ncbi:MAG TPA: hypothetical protein VL945_02695 [Candidatus Saccharimonadales bacterium]|nr:hypothetical protein [Candidatus Saccharimonadales bacterium]